MINKLFLCTHDVYTVSSCFQTFPKMQDSISLKPSHQFNFTKYKPRLNHNIDNYRKKQDLF